jgi:hypothetical protein
VSVSNFQVSEKLISANDIMFKEHGIGKPLLSDSKMLLVLTCLVWNYQALYLLNKIRTLHIYDLWDSLTCIQLLREFTISVKSMMLIVLHDTYINAS